MEWTEQHDIILCREILVTNPFSAKKKTTQRKKLWDTVAQNDVKINTPKFKASLSERSVRERYSRIAQKYKSKMQEEIRASGISPEQGELDVLLEELSEREEMAEEERYQQEKKAVKDQEKAKDIRLQAMERLSQTKKRKSQENDSDQPNKKSRRTSSEAISYLREKTQQEMVLRKQELELRSKEYGEERKRREEADRRHDNMMQMMAQQNQLMLSLMSDLVKK